MREMHKKLKQPNQGWHGKLHSQEIGTIVEGWGELDQEDTASHGWDCNPYPWQDIGFAALGYVLIQCWFIEGQMTAGSRSAFHKLFLLCPLLEKLNSTWFRTRKMEVLFHTLHSSTMKFSTKRCNDHFKALKRDSTHLWNIRLSTAVKDEVCGPYPVSVTVCYHLHILLMGWTRHTVAGYAGLDMPFQQGCFQQETRPGHIHTL